MAAPKLTFVRCPDQLTRAAPPAERPLLVYDGDCYFCLRWIRRWQETTQGRVDVAPFQSVGDRLAEDIPAECFRSAIRLIETDGRIFGVPGYAPVARLGYEVIARRRELASFVTTALWGKGEEAVCRPTYYYARRWFLRVLGVVYLIAFALFWIQIDGLIGHDGIAPLTPWLVRDPLPGLMMEEPLLDPLWGFS